MSQLWQDSTLLWSLKGDTVRGRWEKDFLNFSGESASLCDLPLWISRPFTVLKLELKSEMKSEMVIFHTNSPRQIHLVQFEYKATLVDNYNAACNCNVIYPSEVF